MEYAMEYANRFVHEQLIIMCMLSQVDAARFRIYEGANQVKDKAAKYSEEAKNYVKAKTDTSVAA